MQVETLKSNVSDNFFYLVHDGAIGVLIDPIDSATAIAAVEAAGVDLEWVVNTHFHPDHVGGNDAVLDHFADAKLCAGADHEMISGKHPIDRVLEAGVPFEVGTFGFDILDTPGHTAGHISLLSGGHLFSGDVIFVGGAGNCRFGGDPGVLFRTYRDVLAALPDATKFYPGHDYSMRNIEFALSIEPNRDETRHMLELARKATRAPVLTTLGEEREYNPFFRFDDPALQAALQSQHAGLWSDQRALSESDDEAAFRTARALRNSW